MCPQQVGGSAMTAEVRRPKRARTWSVVEAERLLHDIFYDLFTLPRQEVRLLPRVQRRVNRAASRM
jgi:hypothetical protein